MSQLRVKVGDVVCWTGIAARSFCDEKAIVVDVYPNKDGIELMDQYAVLSTGGHTGTDYAAELERTPSPQAPES